MCTSELTPEHNKREQDEGLHPEIKAAFDYVDSVIPTAGAKVGCAPVWFGWALREAFLAGASHSADKSTKK